MLLPTSLGLLLPEFPPAERAAAIGVWAAIGGLAAAAGPPIGGLLVQGSWRLVFFVNVPVGLVALAYGARLLHESSDDGGERPDLLGSALIVASIGLLALGLVKAPDWGWGNARTLAALAVAAVGLGVFARRCATHSSPVIEPAVVRVRSFASANVASVLFSAAFAAMLLGNVLFMTLVWHDSVLVAGVSLAAGPAMATVVALPTGRVANRVGQALLATAGLVLFAIACLWWRLRVGATPDYAGVMLPGLLLSGAGVGLVLPTLASASASSLPPARFATGSAVYAMSRQIGFVLGVSILVAVLGTVSPRNAVVAFDRGWTFMVISALAAAVVAASIGRIDPLRETVVAAKTGAAAAPVTADVGR